MENAIELENHNKFADVRPTTAFNSILKGFVNKLVLNGVGKLIAMNTTDYSILLSANTACDNPLSGSRLLKTFYQDNYVEVYGTYLKEQTIQATHINFGKGKKLAQATKDRDVEFEGKITQIDQSQVVVSNISFIIEDPSIINTCHVALATGDTVSVKAAFNHRDEIFYKGIALLN